MATYQPVRLSRADALAHAEAVAQAFARVIAGTLRLGGVTEGEAHGRARRILVDAAPGALVSLGAGRGCTPGTAVQRGACSKTCAAPMEGNPAKSQLRTWG
jgi:hypothetical protein